MKELADSFNDATGDVKNQGVSSLWADFQQTFSTHFDHSSSKQLLG
jgi:hypothetical protein